MKTEKTQGSLKNNPNTPSPIVYIGLDEKDQEKVQEKFKVGSRVDYNLIAEYFIKYYNLPQNNKSHLSKNDKYYIPDVAVKNRTPFAVSVRRWIVFFAFQTDKYTYRQLSDLIGSKDSPNRSAYLIKNIEQELTVNKVLLKEFNIHLKNLTDLFITFPLLKTK